MDLIQETLTGILERTAPGRILCVADGDLPGLETYLGHHDDCVVERLGTDVTVAGLDGLGRHDLGLMCGALESLPVEDGSALIARLRDVHCRRLCVTWRPTGRHGGEASWTHERFLALALALCRRIDQDGVRTEIYIYDIDYYNPRREWNNPDKWANPQNFRRYRW